MINGQRNYKITPQASRENFPAKSIKRYHAIKKTEEKTENTISKHRKYISKDSDNRENKTHKGTHNKQNERK